MSTKVNPKLCKHMVLLRQGNDQYYCTTCKTAFHCTEVNTTDGNRTDYTSTLPFQVNPFLH